MESGLPLVDQMAKSPPAVQETQVQSLGWKRPLEKGMEATPGFLPGEFQGQRSLAGYSPWVTESDMAEPLTLSYLSFTFMGLKTWFWT